MSEYFPEQKSLGKVKVETNLSNYATETDLRNAKGIYTSSFAKKVDLSNLKSNLDKLDIDKVQRLRYNLSNLKSKVEKVDVGKILPVPIDLSKLSDVVKNNVFNDKALEMMLR